MQLYIYDLIGDLHLKITSGNEFIEAQFKNIFISSKSPVLFLRHSHFYILNHSINIKIVTSLYYYSMYSTFVGVDFES